MNWLLALIFLFGSALHAAEKKTVSKKWGADFEISRSTSLYDLQNGQRYDGMDYLAGASYRESWGTISSKISYTQDLNDQTGENSTINDANLVYQVPKISLGQRFLIYDINWGSSVSALIPLSKKSTSTDQLQTGIIASTGLKFFVNQNVDWSGSYFGFSISGAQFFHPYDTNEAGAILIKNSSNQSFYAGYDWGELSLTLSYANSIRWPYRGNSKQSFVLTENLTYQFSPIWSATLTHSNSGNVLKPNGSDSNISFTDDDNSIVSLGVGVAF